MAILKLYYTNLDISRNMVIESIDDYLATCDLVYQDNNFQFVKPALEQTIKINIPADSDVLDTSLFKLVNFCSIYETANSDTDCTGANYFYYITRAEWVADYTVRLTLALDTLNTWWPDINVSISDKTHITREHKDRFGFKDNETITEELEAQDYFYLDEVDGSNYIYLCDLVFQNSAWKGATMLEFNFTNNRSDLNISVFDSFFNPATGTFTITFRHINQGDLSDLGVTFQGTIKFITPYYYYRKIDKNSEGLNPVVFGENVTVVDENSDSPYIVYSSTKQLEACFKQPKEVTVPGDNTLNVGDLPIGFYYYFRPEWKKVGHNKRDIEFTLTTNNGTVYDGYVTQVWSDYWKYWRGWIEVEPTATGFKIRTGGQQRYSSTIESWEDWETCTSITISGTENVRAYKSSSSISNINTLQNCPEVYIAVTSTNRTVSNINAVNRSDNDLVKIIESPYPVFDGNSAVGWAWDSGTKMLQANFDTQLESTIVVPEAKNPLKPIIADMSSIHLTDAHNKYYESKLYHSDFYQPKFVYDSFTKSFALERVNIDKVGLNLLDSTFDIRYKMTNTINSRFLFDFTEYVTDGNALEDYENILIATRSNELPIYNSEYFNYLRLGYNYDVKAKNIQTGAAAGGAAISLAGSAASIGIAVAAGAGSGSSAGPVGIAVGAAVGVVGAIISIVSQSQLQANSIEQKEKQYLNQAMSVRGCDDIDLLNYYSGNKAKLMLYKTSDQMTNAIYNLLRLTGYACDEYAKPKLDTRVWYNFIQCEPAFKPNQNAIYEEFLDDIKARFQLGVTLYHKTNGTWDLNQEKENYESWLFN